MKILVAGQAKSGTTALYYALKQALPRNYTCLFEPRSYTGAGSDGCVLAKVLINPSVKAGDFETFHKKILIVRDPRDNLLSRLLYAVYDQKFFVDDDKVRIFIKHLEQKQRNPAGLPLIELLKVLSNLSGEDMLERFVIRHRAGLEFDILHRNYFVYKYEHFVAGQSSGLEEYLGFALNFNVNVDATHSRVARTKGAGDWRNWFTEQDVEYFSDIYHDYLVKYGYDVKWELSPEPEILPEYSTEYVMRLVRERRSI
jgi:hypothetical protein